MAMNLLFSPHYCCLAIMAMAFLLLHWEQPMVVAINEVQVGVPAPQVQPPFIQISRTKMKRLLDILNARSRKQSEGKEDSAPFPVNRIKEAMVPISFKYIRPSRPLSENRDIVGWERLGWGWK